METGSSGSGPARRVVARLDELALLSQEEGRLTRTYLSDAHRRAVDLVAGWMRDAGMSVRLDVAATLIGRYDTGSDTSSGRRTLLLGSHLDTVRDAGRYDGMLGVVAAIEAVHELAREEEQLPFAIEVLAFGDEEGVRFPRTLTGSRAAAGAITADDLEACDADGITLAGALRGFGCDPDRIAEAARKPEDLVGYVELHIEQGRVLQTAGRALGAVSGISGAVRSRFVIVGEAGHAGTTAMDDRRDALTCAAEMILAIERRAAETDDLVMTVGTLEVAEAGVNVVPGKVEFSLDLRALDDALRRQAYEAAVAECEAIATRRGLRMREDRFYDEASVLCEPALMTALKETLSRLGDEAALSIPSMAGHDGLAMAQICPMAMLFVRCRDGVSHSPNEHVDLEDIAASVEALTDFIRQTARDARAAKARRMAAIGALGAS